MEYPLVSVIIPCYNAEAYLESALNSILRQSYKNIEIVLIDDGSTDNSHKIYQEIQSKDPRVKVFKNESNLGLIATLNRGIKLAKGELIARMDADDISEKKRIEKQQLYLKNNSTVSLVGTSAIQIDSNSKPLTAIDETYLEANTIKISAYFSQPLVHGSIMAKREIFETYTYDKDYIHSEDFELWLRMVHDGVEIANLSDKAYFYRQNESGVSKQNEAQQNASHNKASAKYIELLLGEKIDKHLIAIINNRPLDKVKVSDYKAAVSLFNKIIANTAIRKTSEVRLYLIRQKNNIIMQSLKKALGMKTIIYLSFTLMWRLRFFESWRQIFKMR